jgi:hypothetical protein
MQKLLGRRRRIITLSISTLSSSSSGSIEGLLSTFVKFNHGGSLGSCGKFGIALLLLPLT